MRRAGPGILDGSLDPVGVVRERARRRLGSKGIVGRFPVRPRAWTGCSAPISRAYGPDLEGVRPALVIVTVNLGTVATHSQRDRLWPKNRESVAKRAGSSVTSAPATASPLFRSMRNRRDNMLGVRRCLFGLWYCPPTQEALRTRSVCSIFSSVLTPTRDATTPRWMLVSPNRRSGSAPRRLLHGPFTQVLCALSHQHANHMRPYATQYDHTRP